MVLVHNDVSCYHVTRPPLVITCGPRHVRRWLPFFSVAGQRVKLWCLRPFLDGSTLPSQVTLKISADWRSTALPALLAGIGIGSTRMLCILNAFNQNPMWSYHRYCHRHKKRIVHHHLIIPHKQKWALHLMHAPHIHDSVHPCAPSMISRRQFHVCVLRSLVIATFNNVLWLCGFGMVCVEFLYH